MGKSIAPEILPASGNFRTVALKQLTRRRNLGGSRRRGQFSVGFPISGALPQNSVYDIDDKRLRGRIPRSQLFGAASSRFRERAAKSGHNDGQLLRGESLQEVRWRGAGRWPPIRFPLMESRFFSIRVATTLVFASVCRGPANCGPATT